MRIAVPVVADGFFLYGFRREYAAKFDRLLFAGENADFEGGQRTAGVAFADFGQKIQRVFVQHDRVFAEAALPIRGGTAEQRLDVIRRQGFELENPAPAQKGVVDREEGILRRGSDQNDHAVFDFRQQHVLLRFVETMNFVDEQQRFLLPGGKPIGGFGQDFTQLLHAVRHRAKLPERAPGCPGQDVRQGRFARARRTVKNHRAEPIRFQKPTQQFAFAEKMFLPDEFVQRLRTHPYGQRLGTTAVFTFLGFEQRHTIFSVFGEPPRLSIGETDKTGQLKK